ncbi:MAG: CDP-diacylglycerol--glycerol-3-phosphate 3-phosphatidyltransferase [Clostridia bacterium]|nr:CDP-diacylglycerol--glycerol-3-phosphate 3-phosphatidyltransferase [Clostridia bacterium]
MNLPNKLTLIRIALIPVFLFFLMTDFVPYSVYIALAVFVIASATDALDGHIARSRNLVTDFGKFADPLADKILVLSALIGLIELGQIGAVPVIIIIAREFMVTGLRIVAIGSGKVIAAGTSGKIKTVLQIIVTVLLMLIAPLRAEIFALEVVAQVGIWAMVAITVYSGAEYIIQNWSIIDYRK